MYHSKKVIEFVQELVVPQRPNIYTTHNLMRSVDRLKPNHLNKNGIRTFKNFILMNREWVKGKTIGIRVDWNLTFKLAKQSLRFFAKGYEVDSEKRMDISWTDVRTAVEAGMNVVLIYHVEDKNNIMGVTFKDNKMIFEKMKHRVEREFGKGVIKIDRVKSKKFAGIEALWKLRKVKQGKIRILLLQNIRINEKERMMEKKNQNLFPKMLDYLDVYMNAGFDFIHRVQWSNNFLVSAMKKLHKPVMASDSFVNSSAKLHVLHDAFLKYPERSVVVSGGTKIMGDPGGAEMGKIDILRSFVDKGIKDICVGGKMALYFMKARGMKVGVPGLTLEEALAQGIPQAVWDKQKLDPAGIRAAIELLETAEQNGVNIIIPKDFRTVSWTELPNVFGGGKHIKDVHNVKEIADDQIYLDIGRESEELYAERIKAAEYRFFNGPMGVFENPQFAHGTDAIIKAFAEVTHGYGILGGGDTDSAIKKSRLLDHSTEYSILLTGGGAAMAYVIDGLALPSIKVLQYTMSEMYNFGYDVTQPKKQ